MNSSLEKSIQETQQDTNDNNLEADNHVEISNNQETHHEFFFSDSEEEIIPNSYKYEKILSHKEENDGNISYLVKYPDLSYHHVEWILEDIILKQDGGKELIQKYRILHPKGSDPPETPFDPQYLNIEKLITFQQENNGSKLYLTKWRNLDYQNLTWETESSIPQNFINDFLKSNQIPDFNEHFIKRKTDYSTWLPLNVPDFSPKKHQIEGLKYITHSFCNEQNIIIGDEIGLGSSIQCAMFLKWLTYNENNRGPFLIIATEKRIEEWKESLNKLQFGPVLTFLKPKIQRDTIAEYELFYPGTKLAKTNLVLSNFSIQVHNKILSEVNWQSIFVDLNHFSDDDEKRKCLTQDFFNLLSEFESSFIVLITQLQTDDLILLKNYFGLLFKNLAKVVLNFTQQLSEQDQIIIFKSILQSTLIQRTFSEINIVHHPITEYIIDCGLTEIQLDYSQSVYQKYISYIVNRNNGYLIKSIFNDLLFICTHPYLHKGAQESIVLNKKFSDLSKEVDESISEFSQKTLIESSSKMKFLDKIVDNLKRNKGKNNRLIVFSHHDDILDLIQEYFEYKGIFYERIGGNTRGEQRNDAIMKFNMICSIDFAFLVCLTGGINGIKLNNANNAILIDSNWNPKKDIEDIINMIDSNELNIYRLLPSRTVERLTYDRSILRSSHPEIDKLTINSEISTLLGLGIDLHDTIEYEKDSIEEILDRSTRNYYQNSQDQTLLNCTKSPFSFNDKVKHGPWPNFVPYNVNEEFQNEKLPNLRMAQNSSIFWTPEKLVTLSEGLIRFGWGRWSTIHSKYEEILKEATDFEMAAICHIFLRIFLKSTNTRFPIVNSIHSQPLSAQSTKFEEKFRRENSDLQMSLFIDHCDEKLSSIEFMYLINVIVATCPKPPEEIAVPYLESTLNDSWNEDADRYLIFHVYNNGYMKFGNSSINPALLEYRLKLIIETLKERFLLYHELKNNTSQFEHFSLIRAVNMLTCEEQQQFIQFLIYYGWTTPEDFKLKTGSYRTPKELSVIHEIITGFCRGQKEMINDLAESIPNNIARLILNREKLLYKVRNDLKKEEVKKIDWPIIEYVIENGFIDLYNCEEIRQRFGNNLSMIEYKVANFLLKYFHNFQLFGTKDIIFNQKSQISHHNENIINNDQEKQGISASSSYVSPHLKNKVSSQVNIEYDKDGNPIMPIQITPSLIIVNLGEIVTEKPNFYNSRYIYPKNFTSLKMYKSPINPNDRVWYKSTIIDDGTDSPLFRVELKDDPSIFYEGRAPSNPWLEFLKVINDNKNAVGQQKSKKVTVSGPEYFGLAAPVVQSLIQQMKGADICINYGKVEEIKSELPFISPFSSSTSNIFPQSSTDSIEIESKNNENVKNNENENEDSDGMLKIVPRKREKKISYAESSFSSSSESEDNIDQKDKEFSAANENDDEDDDDENEPFEDEDDDFEGNDEDIENDLVEQKKSSSRTSRSYPNAHSVVTHSQNSIANGKSNNNNDGEDCAIQ